MHNIPPNQIIDQANQLIKAGQRDKAYHMLQELVFSFPDEGKAWWLIANLSQDLAEKRYALEQVLRLYPNSEKARMQLAQLPPLYQNIPPQPAYYPPPTTSQSNQKGLLILGVLLIFVCGGISFFVGTQINNQSNNSATNGINTNTNFNDNSQSNTITNNNTNPTSDNANNNPLFMALQGEWERRSSSSVMVVDDSDSTIRFFSDGTVNMDNITGAYTFLDSSTMRIDFPPLASVQVREMSPILSVAISGDELIITHVNNERTTTYMRPWAVSQVDDVYNIIPNGDGMFVTSGNSAIPLYLIGDGNFIDHIPYFPTTPDTQPAIILTGTTYDLDSQSRYMVFMRYPFGIGIQMEANGGIVIVTQINSGSNVEDYGLQLYDGITVINDIGVVGESSDTVANIMRDGVYNSLVNLIVVRGDDTFALSIPRNFQLTRIDLSFDSVIKPGGLLYITYPQPLPRGHYCFGAPTVSGGYNYGCFTIQ